MVWLRSTIGMGAASKAQKRSRRVSASNAFIQSKMKGKGLKVGTNEYKKLYQSFCDEWRTMSDQDKVPFENLAAQQTSGRKCASEVLLSDQKAFEELRNTGSTASSLPLGKSF